MGLELAKAYVTVGANAQGLLPGLNGLRPPILNWTKSVTGAVTGMLTSGITMGLGAIGIGSIGAALTKGLVDSAAVEQTNIAFETMLGSAEKAQKLVAQMTAFAAKTPFELPGITGTAKTLLAFGMTQEQIMPTLKTLGDVAAGTGKDLQELGVIYGQIRASGRLMGGDMLQLVNAGVPIITTLAKQYGVAEGEIKKMSEAGKISFADVEKAFQTMSGEGGIFFNMMERQSGTMGGMWSTLQDAISMFLQKAVKPLFPIVKNALDFMIKKIEVAGEWIDIFAHNWSGTWEMMKQGAIAAISAIWDYFVDFIRESPKILIIPVVGAMNFTESMIRNIGRGVPEAIVQAQSDAMAGNLEILKSMDFGVSEGTQRRIDKMKEMAAELKSAYEANKPAMDDAAESTGAKAGDAMAKALKDAMIGFIGIEEIGRKSQELALKAEKDGPQAKLVGIAELQLKKQEEIVQAIKNQKGSPAAVLQ